MKTVIKKIEDWLIETPEGYVEFDGIGKVEELQTIIEIELEDGNTIGVDLSHIFIVDDIEVMSKDLIVGDILETKEGLKEIVNIKILDKLEQTYTPLEVKSSDHSYYADGIKNKNCKFLGSSNTLIDSDVLERANYKTPIMTKWTGLFNIYEEPVAGALYILGIDSGKGVKLDSSVIQVLRIYGEKELKQVATYRNNAISPHDFAQVCISVSDYYNEAQMMIENNDIGHSVCDAIFYEYDCDRIVNIDPKGLGIRSTRRSKLDANMLLKRYLENSWLELNDQQTLFELSRYEEITPNVYACGRHDHDDTITSLLWALYFIITDFYDGRDENTKRVEDKFRVRDEDVEDDGEDSEGPAFAFE